MFAFVRQRKVRFVRGFLYGHRFLSSGESFHYREYFAKREIRLELISTFILPDEDSFAFGMRLGESSVMVRYVLWN